MESPPPAVFHDKAKRTQQGNLRMCHHHHHFHHRSSKSCLSAVAGIISIQTPSPPFLSHITPVPPGWETNFVQDHFSSSTLIQIKKKCKHNTHTKTNTNTDTFKFVIWVLVGAFCSLIQMTHIEKKVHFRIHNNKHLISLSPGCEDSLVKRVLFVLKENWWQY